MTRHKSDEELASEFLAGKREQSAAGQITHCYLDPGSPEEIASLQALARLLRGDAALSVTLRFRLASLFDPETKFETRKFAIENRHRGPQPDHFVEIEIAIFIAEAVASGVQMKVAQADAVQRYRVSNSTVERAWRDHKNSELVRPLWQGDRTIN
jgi:hypothetical protein